MPPFPPSLPLSFGAALAEAHTMIGDTDYDVDAGGLVFEKEFNTGLGEAGLFGDADADGFLSEDEFGSTFGENRVLTDHDGDADGLVSEAEFSTGFYGG